MLECVFLNFLYFFAGLCFVCVCILDLFKDFFYLLKKVHICLIAGNGKQLNAVSAFTFDWVSRVTRLMP